MTADEMVGWHHRLDGHEFEGAEESREDPPNCTVSLTSQRHSEKLPEVAGTSQGNPGFYAVIQERPRESFNPS